MIGLYLLQSFGTRYLLPDVESATRWQAGIEPWYCVARVLAYVEAFLWFARSFPSFRVGWLLFPIGTLAGALLQSWVPSGDRAAMLHYVALVERSTGLGIAASVLIAVGWYEYFGAPSPDAKWHAAVLAAWSVLDGIGWWRISHGRWNEGGWWIVSASIICPALWMLAVKSPPRWDRRGPDAELAESWARVAAGRSQTGS